MVVAAAAFDALVRWLCEEARGGVGLMALGLMALGSLELLGACQLLACLLIQQRLHHAP